MVARELKEQTDELLRREDSRLATFAGESAETANLELLALAKAQTNEGVDPREIWESTGWFKGKDGEWRFEIDDSKASMVEGEIIHNELEKAYPGLFEDINVSVEPLREGLLGSFSSDTNELKISSDSSPEEQLSTALHELQHYVQDTEGFTRGGNRAGMQAFTPWSGPKKAEEAFTDIVYMNNHPLLSDKEAFTKILRERTGYEPAKVLLNDDFFNSFSILREFLKDTPPEEWENLFGVGLSEEDLQRIDNTETLRRPNEFIFRTLKAANPEVLEGVESHEELTDLKAPEVSKDEALLRYRNILGEAEARATQARQEYTPEERRSRFPTDTYSSSEVGTPYEETWVEPEIKIPFAEGGLVGPMEEEEQWRELGFGGPGEPLFPDAGPSTEEESPRESLGDTAVWAAKDAWESAGERVMSAGRLEEAPKADSKVLEAFTRGLDYFGDMGMAGLEAADAAWKFSVGLGSEAIPFQDAQEEKRFARDVISMPDAFAGMASGFRGVDQIDDIAEAASGVGRQALHNRAMDKAIESYDPSVTSMFGAGSARNGPSFETRLRAAEMKEQGVDDYTIWEETGLQFSPEKNSWQFEIDSSGMRLKLSDDNEEISEQDILDSLYDVAEEIVDASLAGESQYLYLGDLVEFDALFENYPSLRDSRLTFQEGGGASYSPNENIVSVGLDTLGDTEEFKDVLVHELQHGVQNIEGHARGSNYQYIMENHPDFSKEFETTQELLRRAATTENPEEKTRLLEEFKRIGTDLRKRAFKFYEANEGEIEARAAELRRHLTANEKRETPPSATMRMALNDAMERYRNNTPEGTVKEYSKGGFVGNEKTLKDYFKASSGNLPEEAFRQKHGMSTLEFENKFEEENNVDISGAETLGDTMDKDPISGNPVPPGSKPEEVRDNVPAKLSEGEYVVPADVVRFFGVNFFEDLRRKAKEGMLDMEKGGRMGEEAPLPPEVQQAGQRIQEYAQGGLVDDASLEQMIDKVAEAARTNPKLSGIFQKKGISMAEGGLVDEPTFDPNQWQTVGASQFQGMSQGQNYEYRPYVGPNGATQMILFVNGSPAMTIPEGYVPQEQYQEKSEETSRSRSSTRDRRHRNREYGDRSNVLFSPLEALDFNNTEDTQSWAEEQLQGSMALDAASSVLGPVGGSIARLLPKARNIAEVRAAAFGAEEQGNTSLAESLRTRADEAERESGLLGVVPDEWLDGDRIYQNYASRRAERESSGSRGLDLPPEIEEAIRGSSSSSRGSSGRSSSGSSGSRSRSISRDRSSPRSSFSTDSEDYPTSSSTSGSSGPSLSFGDKVSKGKSLKFSPEKSLSYGKGSSSVDPYSTDASDYQFKKGGLVPRKK